MSSSSVVNEIAVLNINCLLGENMKKIMLAVALMVSVMAVNVANAAVSLKSSGDQWGPAVQDLMNAKENGNWNESRFISTFNSRFNGTAEEAKALLDSLKAGNIPQSAESFNNSISTPNPGNGNGNGNSGGSTCTGNPHNCNSGVTKDELDASQKAQDDKQVVVDKAQDDKLADHDSRIKDLEDNKPTNGKDGVDGQKGEKGDTGATGAAGKDGKDGADGKDGKDADMTLVNQNTSDISDLKATKADKADLNKEVNDRKSADKNLQNQINANNLHDVIQDAAIVGLAVTKADKADLNKESAERKAADVALNGKIDQAVSNQAIVDKAQNTAIGNAQTSANNAQNTANVALGVGIANSIGLAAESAQRSLADAALNNKIDKNKADQVLVDNAQNDHINAVQNAAQTANDRATDLEKRADTVEKNVRDTNAQLEVTDARSINNAQRLDSVESKNAEQDSLISTKADKTALDKETADRKASDAVLGGAIVSEGVARAAGDAALNTKIDSNKAAQKVTDDAQDAVINTKASKKDLTSEVAERKSADTKLQKNINREANTRAQADAVLSSRIDNNDATLVQHDERITSNTQRVGAVEGRVSNLEQSTNKRFSQMDKRIGDNRKLASAGIAGAGAMANIPQVSQGSTFSVGAGVGGYDSEQAVAVGFSARVNNNVVTKMSVSTNTQSEILWGAGVGVEW